MKTSINKYIPLLVKGWVRGGLIIIMFLFIFQSKINPVFAQGTPWRTININCVSTVDATVPSIQGFECLFTNILTIIVTVAGLAFIVMFIVGGFQYMQSSNDPKAVAGASSTLTYAIIGLVGIIISWLILAFIQQFTGANVIEFKIPK
ncbi:MAG: hypothetical protein WC069_05640 [Candidatus Shapirobacteria bacterium]